MPRSTKLASVSWQLPSTYSPKQSVVFAAANAVIYRLYGVKPKKIDRKKQGIDLSKCLKRFETKVGKVSNHASKINQDQIICIIGGAAVQVSFRTASGLNVSIRHAGLVLELIAGDFNEAQSKMKKATDYAHLLSLPFVQPLSSPEGGSK